MKTHAFIVSSIFFIYAVPAICMAEQEEGLTACIVSNMESGKYTNAAQAGIGPECNSQYTEWWHSCAGEANENSQCTNQYQAYSHQIDDEFYKTHPRPATKPRPIDIQRQRMQMAMADMAAHKPLPGLPDLHRPVYLKPMSKICGTRNELANPETDVELAMGVCITNKHVIRVTIYPPRDADEYLNDHMFGMVSIGWRFGEISNGNVSIGWVGIGQLRN